MKLLFPKFPPLSVHDTEIMPHLKVTITIYQLVCCNILQVMKNQEAVDLVKPIKDPKAAAKRLTAEALARKSKDDISCIVIRFG